MSSSLDVAYEPCRVEMESGALVGKCDVIDAMKLAEMTQAAYGKDVKVVGESKVSTNADSSSSFLSRFELFQSDEVFNAKVPGSKRLSAKLEAAVEQIEEATNASWRDGFTGLGTDEAKLWNAIAPLTAEEFAKVNERFAYLHWRAEQGEIYWQSKEPKWDIQSELKDELNKEELARFNKMIADKSINDVPTQFRTNGESLLKENSQLQVGKMNRVTLSDGREYDVYVPRNADSRGPVMVATGGAGLGDMKGVMSTETGLTLEAEKTGSIVVFGYPKLKTHGSGWKSAEGVAWNVPGRTNMPEQSDKSYDDRRYMDNVLRDLNDRTHRAEKVGMIGFSDGARFAEVYAADRPNKVAGIVSMSGTWMQGDTAPKSAVPIMIVHGSKDEMLPYDGGVGRTSERVPIATNLDKSQPYMQAQVWSAAGGGDGKVIARIVDSNVEERVYAAGSSTVQEFIIKDADHAIHDYKNNGSRLLQWALGKPALRHDFVSKGVGFLKERIVRDISGNKV